MATVLLVVTGDLERRALRGSLKRYFPEVDFEIQQTSPTTSNPLPDPDLGGRLGPMERLAEAIVAAVTKGPRGTPPDFVFAVDDLELANASQPRIVVEWVRRTVRACLEREYSDARALARASERVQQRCSFHLFAPMPEAYFYGDPGALTQVGVSPGAPRITSADLEQFETDDPGYLAGSRAQARRRAGKLDPARHPKDYLEHLCEQVGGLYEETTSGKRALESLAWPDVLAHHDRTRFARSLFEDLADALEVPSPVPSGQRHPLTYPERSVKRASLVLRNL